MHCQKTPSSQNGVNLCVCGGGSGGGCGVYGCVSVCVCVGGGGVLTGLDSTSDELARASPGTCCTHSQFLKESTYLDHEKIHTNPPGGGMGVGGGRVVVVV